MLVERYQRRVVSVSYGLVGSIHDALEIGQEAFVRAYKNLESLADETRFGPWLMKITTNLSLNFRRDRAAAARRVPVELSDDPLHNGKHSPPGERPGAALSASELRSIVQDAIAQLSAAQRTALILFSIEQLPQRDVAQIMCCSVEAVKWHVFQARRKLREMLRDVL